MTNQDLSTLPPDLAAVVAEWDAAAEQQARSCFVCRGPARHTINGRRYCDRCAPWPPVSVTRTHLTATMLADIWQDEGGPQRVAGILAGLAWEERERLCQEYWNLLRSRGHYASLVEVGIQFCVVERLAA